MVDRSEITDGMEVVGADGVALGRVLDVESGRIVLGDGADDGTGRRTVALSHVERVEGGRVHLRDSAAVETGGLAARIAEATGDPMPDAPHAPPRKALVGWLIGAAILLGVLLALYTCTVDQQREKLSAPAQIERGNVSPVGTGGAQTVTLPNGRALQLDALSHPMQVNNFLADATLTAPRSFRFDRLNFATGSAAIPPTERAEVDALGQVLAAYPNARARVVGFADAQGPAPANADLGQRRAEAVVAALAAQGVARDRLEAASGGEGAPAATNATAPGRAENRRTELAVLAK